MIIVEIFDRKLLNNRNECLAPTSISGNSNIIAPIIR